MKTNKIIRSQRFTLRLSDAEHNTLEKLEKVLGLSRSEIFRIRVFGKSQRMLVNTVEIMNVLDKTGEEIGRCRDNLSQLTQLANTLRKKGTLHTAMLSDLTPLLKEYNVLQRRLERSVRQLIRYIIDQV